MKPPPMPPFGPHHMFDGKVWWDLPRTLRDVVVLRARQTPCAVHDGGKGACVGFRTVCWDVVRVVWDQMPREERRGLLVKARLLGEDEG